MAETYRLRGGGMLIIDGRDELKELMMQRGVAPAAGHIADVCNDASEWGGYVADDAGEQAAFVDVLGGTADNERGRRLLAALDRGQEAWT